MYEADRLSAYDHQRSVTSDKRVFILTRSAFAGQQRYAANTWSGDIVASWETLRNQISAGLNFSLCGIPYWNSDIGGFFLWDYKKPLENADYRELYARWVQFGTFCPMMRSHGADAPREIRIYPGANGEFTLYEDENDNYNYEKGMYSTINFIWNDAKNTLTINDRNGSFSGIITERKFNIIRVAPANGTGIVSLVKSDKEVNYIGKKVVIKL